MKPMSTKCKAVNTFIMNIPMALFISLTAQLLAIAAGEAPGFSFQLLAINFCLAYVISFIVGMCTPAVLWGLGFAKSFNAEPGSLKFGLLVTEDALQPLQNLLLKTGGIEVYAKVKDCGDRGCRIGFTTNPEGFSELIS